MPQAAIMAAMIGGSAISGALNNRSKTTTSKTTPNWTPEQMAGQHTLGAIIDTDLRNPDQSYGLTPLKTAAVGNINKTYDQIGKRMDSNLAARGFEKSGANASGLRALEMARAGEIGQTEDHFAGMELDQKNRLLQMLQQFSFSSPGSDTTSTMPGNMAGGAVGGAAETATMLFALSHMMGGGSGGSGGGISGLFNGSGMPIDE